ncbi:MAG: LON peptidase substrate-binding domain-containing protein, partial [Lachnospira sp.]
MIKEKDKHKYPAIPLRNTTVFPGMVVHFDVSRKKSVKAVETAMSTDQYIYLVTQLDSQVNEPEFRDLYSLGTIAQIKQIIKMPGRILRVQVEGIDRAEINSFEQEAGIMVAEVTAIAAMQK